VIDLVVERLPATGELTLAALVLSLIVGIPAGIIAAVKRNSWFDNVVMLFALFGQSMPTFWLGIMLIIIFAVTLRWFPTSGFEGPRYVVLPALSLSGFLIALTARLMRSCMLEVLSQDYLRTARAKGLTEFAVVVRHGLRISLIPVITVLGLQVGTLLGGAVMTWPFSANAQPTTMPVVGFLHSGSPGPYAGRMAAFRQGLSDTGFVEGKDVAIAYRWAEGNYERLPEMALDLVRRAVSVIIAGGGVASAPVAKAATSTIPIVFVTGADPVAQELDPSQRSLPHRSRRGGFLSYFRGTGECVGPLHIECGG
jgi:ABC-type proline/glycine betaine transport system permease subunit